MKNLVLKTILGSLLFSANAFSQMEVKVCATQPYNSGTREGQVSELVCTHPLKSLKPNASGNYLMLLDGMNKSDSRVHIIKKLIEEGYSLSNHDGVYIAP